MKIICFYILLFLPLISFAQNKEEMNKKIENAIPLIYNCEFEKADSLFQNIITEYPSEPEGYFFRLW